MTDCLLEKASNHLLAARLMYENIADLYNCALDRNEIYKTAAGLINSELVHIPLSAKVGAFDREKSCSFTPSGIAMEFTNVLTEMDKIIILHAPAGIESSPILSIFCESAICRGLDVKSYFCSMNPEKKMEHLIVPALNLAIVTTNKFHRIQISRISARIIDIDMTQMFSMEGIRFATDIIADSLDMMEKHIRACCGCLAAAEKEESKIKSFRRKKENAFTVCG